MKILVFAHELEIGGTQVNAIELAATLRDRHDCDVALFATPGPMRDLVQQKRLRYYPAPIPAVHPSPARIAALRQVVRREQPDVLHVWDWWQCLEAYYGVHLPLGTPLLITDMMAEPTRLLPRWLPTTFGTPEVAEQAKRRGWSQSTFLPPPVDVQHNAPGLFSSQALRSELGIGPEELVLVSVSRLAHFMKGESIRHTMEAVLRLGRRYPIRYLAIGDGPAKAELERKAETINEQLGRRAIEFRGALLDPRPAYALADVVIGMGGSALRGMAFGKPVIVVGASGFAETLAPETAEAIFYRGTYGHGVGTADRLVQEIATLAASPELRQGLGPLSRSFVVERYSLEAVSDRLRDLCAAAATMKATWPRLLSDSARTAAIYFRERRFLTPSRPAQERRRSRQAV